MPTLVSSKTKAVVITLAIIGLAAAAGFGYWGYKSLDQFTSDYYQQGYQEELNNQP